MCPPGGLPTPSFGVEVAGSIPVGPRLARGALSNLDCGAESIGIGESEHVLEPLVSLIGIFVGISPTVFHFLTLSSVGGAEVLRDEV
ncbi:MAG: hypothetical protein JRN35_04780 [Nitrososphaerota archaeon]|nr:hypothetical protein [Nitrososphaerota archaeon]